MSHAKLGIQRVQQSLANDAKLSFCRRFRAKNSVVMIVDSIITTKREWQIHVSNANVSIAELSSLQKLCSKIIAQEAVRLKCRRYANVKKQSNKTVALLANKVSKLPKNRDFVRTAIQNFMQQIICRNTVIQSASANTGLRNGARKKSDTSKFADAVGRLFRRTQHKHSAQ